MATDQGDDASVANAANWLRLIFHSLTCNNPACVLEDRCSGGKALLFHVLTCTSQGVCAVPSCTSVRRLTLHWLRCQDVQCRLCAGVWRDLSGNDGAHERHQHLRPAPRYSEPLPPEAPGTPDRTGAAPVDISSSNRQPAAYPGGEGLATSGRGHEGAADMQVVDADFDPAIPTADRAVLHLQEATSYMRYLLHCLMCRNARDNPARAPGLQFWLDALMPPQQQQPQPPQPAQGYLQLRHEGATAAAAAAAPAMAGRRLLGHRLTCRNSFCALCSGTCELFTRGRALRGDLPVPSGLQDMDLIVHELSLALGSVNL